MDRTWPPLLVTRKERQLGRIRLKGASALGLWQAVRTVCVDRSFILFFLRRHSIHREKEVKCSGSLPIPLYLRLRKRERSDDLIPTCLRAV